MMSAALLSTAIWAFVGTMATAEAAGDLFVFAYSWQAEFCFGQPSYAGCYTPQSYWEYNFTLHGLWPQYSAGGYPADCTKEPFNTSIPEAVGYDDMIKYWPNVKSAETAADYASFWDHEWTKHGTCTGLDQSAYFNQALDMIKDFGTNAIISENVGKFVDAAAVREAHGGSTMVTLVCKGGKFLSELYTCWSQENGVTKGRTTCPADVQKEDTCSAAEIYIQEWVVPTPVSPPTVKPFFAPTRSPFVSDDDAVLMAQPGDLLVLGFDSVNPDLIYVAATVKVPNGFTFYISDNGWIGSSFRANEGMLTCVLEQGMAPGQVFPASASTCSLSGAFDLSTGGDQILLYTGSALSPSAWLHGVSYSGSWVATAEEVTSSTSMLPDELVGVNLVLPATSKNFVYVGPTSGTVDTLVAAIDSSSNWKGSSDYVFYTGGDLSLEKSAEKSAAKKDLYQNI